MKRLPLLHRIDWELLEPRVLPSQAAAPAVVPAERTDAYASERFDETLQQVALGR